MIRLRKHFPSIMLPYEPDRESLGQKTSPRGTMGNVVGWLCAANSMNNYYAVRAGARSSCAGACSFGFRESLDPGLAERLRFLGACLRDPARVGAFVPSSRAL